MRPLESLERAAKHPVAPGPLVGRVGDELRHEGAARTGRRGGRSGVRRGRVHDVCGPGEAKPGQRDLGVANDERPAPGDAVHGHRQVARLAVGHGHDLHVMTAIAQETCEVGTVSRRPADVGRPDAREEHDPHRTIVGAT